MKQQAVTASTPAVPRVDDGLDRSDPESVVEVTSRREDFADRGVDDGDEASSDGDVAAVAYALYEQRGGTHGHDIEDWLEAERRVRRDRSRPNRGAGGAIQ